jgi:hypothetical protein
VNGILDLVPFASTVPGLGGMNLLKRLTYGTEVIAVARWLGLRPLLKKWHFWWARPRDGVIRIEVNGVDARFYVRTPGELRNLDPVGGARAEFPILGKLPSSARAEFLATSGAMLDPMQFSPQRNWASRVASWRLSPTVRRSLT